MFFYNYRCIYHFLGLTILSYILYLPFELVSFRVPFGMSSSKDLLVVNSFACLKMSISFFCFLKEQ